MEQTKNPKKHLRGSSPRQEMKQGFDSWVRGLRLIKEVPEDLLTLQFVDQRGNHKTELIAQEFDPQPQSDDEGRWQDDGGESG